MSDVEDYSVSGDDDSEGSLVDFIVDSSHDEMEIEDGEEEVEDEDCNEDVEDVNEITQQYSPQLENEGIVTDATGLRRSMRVSKGRAPARYVDEEYVGLMTEDIGSDIDRLSSDDSYDGDESEEFEVEDEEDD